MADHRYLLIVNPEAGSRQTMKALPEIEDTLRSNGMEYEFHFTKGVGHATDLVKEFGAEYDVIVSVGGDGTINEIINGLPGIDKPLGMIPIGTGNDFARSCCIPLNNITEAISILKQHDVKPVDVGVVNGRRFINVMGFGFDGQVNDVVQAIRFIPPAIRVYLAIAFVYLFYRRKAIRVSFDDQVLTDPIFLFAIGNGWNVGGGLQLTPKAIMDDGKFDLSYAPKIGRLRILQVFAKLFDGTITEIPEVEVFQTDKIQIDMDGHVPVHFDGEQFKPVPRSYTITLEAKAQTIIGNWAADKRFD